MTDNIVKFPTPTLSDIDKQFLELEKQKKEIEVQKAQLEKDKDHAGWGS